MQSATLPKLQSPPRTAMEVFELLPEGTLVDVIDNVLYVHAARTVTHQLVLGDVLCALLPDDSGKCVSWVDVYFDENNAVQPDIIFIAKANLGIIKDGKVKGVPDIIIEVLSENKKHDLVRKKEVYEAFGVKEYFIVDQQSKEVITYYFDDGKFIQQEGNKAMLTSKLLNQTFTF